MYYIIHSYWVVLGAKLIISVSIQIRVPADHEGKSSFQFVRAP